MHISFILLFVFTQLVIYCTNIYLYRLPRKTAVEQNHLPLSSKSEKNILDTGCKKIVLKKSSENEESLNTCLEKRLLILTCNVCNCDNFY